MTGRFVREVGRWFGRLNRALPRTQRAAGTCRRTGHDKIEDLEAHGLLGRTPKVNKDAGRDQWGHSGSIVFAGGGVKGGQVIGATDASAAYPRTPAYGPWDVAATVYRALGIPLDTHLTDREGRPVAMLPEGEVIPGVL